MLTARELLELSKRAFPLYEKMDDPKKRELLNLLCSNYTLQEKKLYATYKKPFDILVKGSSFKLTSPNGIQSVTG